MHFTTLWGLIHPALAQLYICFCTEERFGGGDNPTCFCRRKAWLWAMLSFSSEQSLLTPAKTKSKVFVGHWAREKNCWSVSIHLMQGRRGIRLSTELYSVCRKILQPLKKIRQVGRSQKVPKHWDNAASNPKDIHLVVKQVYYLTTFLLASILQNDTTSPYLSFICFFSDIYHQPSTVLCPWNLIKVALSVKLLGVNHTGP